MTTERGRAYRDKLLAAAGAVTAESPARNPFRRVLDDIFEDVVAFGRAARSPLPDADPADLEFMRDGINPLEVASVPFLSFLPRSFETEAPEPLRPAARVARSVVSPGGIVLAPLGGVRAGAASIGGSTALATGLAPFGQTAEDFGAFLGGFYQPGAAARTLTRGPRGLGITPGVPDEIVGGQAARTPQNVQEAVRARELRDLAAQAPAEGTLGDPGQAIPGVDVQAPRTPREINLARRDAVIRDIEADTPPRFEQFGPGAGTEDIFEQAFGRGRYVDADFVEDAYGAVPSRRVQAFDDPFEAAYGARTGRAEISPIEEIAGTTAGPGPLMRSTLEEIYGPYAGAPPPGAPRIAPRPPEPTFYEIAGARRPPEAIVNDYPFPATGSPRAVPPGGAPPTTPPPAGGVPPVSGAVPPPTPPVAPGAPANLPPSIGRSLSQASAMWRQDRPGAISRFVDRPFGVPLPFVKNVRDWERPSREIPENVMTAHIGEVSTRAELQQEMFASRVPLLRRLNEVFGEGASTGGKTNAAFTGTAEQSNKIAGTFKDVAERPSLYNLNQEQRGFLDEFNARNNQWLKRVNTEYGTELTQYDPEPGGAFLPNVDRSEEALATIENRYGQPVGARAAASGRSKERIFRTADERLWADPSFEPETNVETLLNGLDSSKASAAGGAVVRAGVGGFDELPVGSAAAHDYVLSPEIGKYLPSREAAAVKRLREGAAKTGPWRVMADLQATVLGGDFSPLTIQGMQKVLFHPAATAEQIAKGNWGMSPGGLADLVAKDPQGWRDFAFATGRSLTEGTPGEFGTGYLGRIPKVGGKISEANDRLYNFVLSAAKNDFIDDMDELMASGLSKEEAMALAGDFVQRMIPAINPVRYGLSSRAYQQRRGAFTSVSFIRKSAELVADSTRGFAKIAGGAGKVPGTRAIALTPKESLAVRRVTKAAALVGTIAVASAVVDATRTGGDPIQAAKDAIDPNSPRFASLIVAGRRFPLGGPLRAAFAAVYPRKTSWSGGVPVPFGGMSRYVNNRIQPTARTALDVYRNRDFRGRQVYGEDENMALKIAQYVVERQVPTTAGQVLEGVRTGESPGEIAVNTGAQFIGQNVIPQYTTTDLRRTWEKDTATYHDLPTTSREASAKRTMTREFYRDRNPAVEAKLFVTGEIETLRTMRARQEAVALMRRYKLRMADVKAFEVKEFESPNRTALRTWFERALGVKSTAKPGTGGIKRIPLGGR